MDDGRTSDGCRPGSGTRPQGVPTFGDFAAARYSETDAAALDAGCRCRKVGTSTKKSSRKTARTVGVPNYDVPIFRPTEWELRNAFWHGGRQTEKMKKAIRSGFLGRTVHVYARTKIEAAMRAEAENPGWQADSELVRNSAKDLGCQNLPSGLVRIRLCGHPLRHPSARSKGLWWHTSHLTR